MRPVALSITLRQILVFTLALIAAPFAFPQQCELVVEPPDENYRIHYELISDCPAGGNWDHTIIKIDGQSVYSNGESHPSSYYIGCLPAGAHTFTVEIRRAEDGRFCGCWLDETIPFSVQRSEGTIRSFAVDDGVATITVIGEYLPPAYYILDRIDLETGAVTNVSEGQLSTTLSVPVPSDGMYLLRAKDCSGVAQIPEDQMLPSGSDEAPALSESYDPSCETPGGSACCSGTCFGGPVKSTSGNMRYSDTDPLPGLGVERIYDSARPVTPTRFGERWFSMFDARVISSIDDRVLLVDKQAQIYSFRRFGSTYEQEWPIGGTPSTLTTDSEGLWVHRLPNSLETYHYGVHGLRKIASLDTHRDITIEYDAYGRPAVVNDSWQAWSWNIATDVTSGRITAITVAGQPSIGWHYVYDGDALESVLSATSTPWRTYDYGPYLLAAHDPLGNLIESHTFNGAKAVSDSSSGSEITSVVYSQPGRVDGERYTQTTAASGATTRYYSRVVAGSRRIVEVDGSCDCGGDVVYAYDANGRILREQNERGYVSEYQYEDFSNVRISARTALRPSGCDPATNAVQCRMSPDTLASVTLVATNATALRQYEYEDASWPEMPTEIRSDSVADATGQRVEQFTYDSDSGNVLTTAATGYLAQGIPETRTVTRTHYGSGHQPRFSPGGSFDPAWEELGQPLDMLAALDGARTDVNDITEYVYYPAFIPTEYQTVNPPIPPRWRGRVAAVRNAAGQITRFEDYDVWGNARRVIDPNGVVTDRTFDPLGRLVTSTLRGVSGCDTALDPLCATDITTTRTYASTFGPLQSESHGDGVTVYTYDARGRTQTISRGPTPSDLRERIEYSYDPVTGKKSLERRLAFESAAWVEKWRESYTYGVGGKLENVIHADTTSVHYDYQAGGLVAATKDERHTSANAEYTYDPAGRLRTVTQTLGAGEIATAHTYDLAGNLTSMTDANGNVTTYTYNDFGEMVRQESPVTGDTTYVYDAAGQLVATTDANGATTTRSYDAIGRITTSTSTLGVESESITWTYDDGPFGSGRLTQVTDPAAATAFAYDRRGLLLREVRTIESGASYETLFHYDDAGNRTRVVGPSGRITDYTFDYADRPYSATSDGTPIVTSAHYLPFGPPLSIVFGNGTTRTMTSDNRYRPLTNIVSGPNGAIASYVYTHDAAGNITALEDAVDSSYDRTYTYDDLNRLTTASSSGLWGNGSFSYDAMGNITTWVLGAATKAFTYAAPTPLLTSVNNGASTSVSYDAAGNELTVGARANIYSPRNLLASDGTAEYRYDARGIRTEAILGPAPIELLSIELDAESVFAGDDVDAEITLTGPAPAGGLVVDLSSDTAAASVPASVTVTEGESSAPFTIETTTVAVATTATISATLGLSAVDIELLIDPAARLADLSFDPIEIAAGGSAIGTIALDSPAPTGGATIALSADAPAILTVPTTATILEGETSASFTASAAGPVAAVTQVVVTAEYAEEEEDAEVALLPPAVVSLTVTPSTIEGGQDVGAEVQLAAPAAAGTEVTFASTNAAVDAPSPLTIAAGATSGQTTIRTDFAAQQQTAVLSAILEPTSATANLTVQPLAVSLDSISMSPNSVIGSDETTLTVTLTGTAIHAVEVELVGGSGSLEHLPFVTIPVGQSQASIPIRTAVDIEGETVTVHARHGLTEEDAQLEIQPPPGNYVSSLALDVPRATGGDPVTATLELDQPAIFGNNQVTLTSSAPSIVIVPSKVGVTVGSSLKTFTVDTETVTLPTDVTITAEYNDVMQRVRLTVIPTAQTVTLESVSLPATTVGGGNVTGTVTLSGPAPSGGATVVLGGTRSHLATVPPSVLVPQDATSADFTVTTEPTPYARGILLTASYNQLTRSAALVIDEGQPLRAPSTQTTDAEHVRSSRRASHRQVSSQGRRRISALSYPVRRLYFYSPELNLLAETNATSAAAPDVEHEYIWFAGQPIAQVETTTSSIAWYFNDHLGTPVVQTDANASVMWRVEREPYGKTFTIRTGAGRHQPLAFPGQEEHGGEVSYNIFRWYRPDWGRYSTADPLGPRGLPHLYAYANQSPGVFTDALGLFPCGKQDPCFLQKNVVFAGKIVTAGDSCEGDNCVSWADKQFQEQYGKTPKGQKGGWTTAMTSDSAGVLYSNGDVWDTPAHVGVIGPVPPFVGQGPSKCVASCLFGQGDVQSGLAGGHIAVHSVDCQPKGTDESPTFPPKFWTP